MDSRLEHRPIFILPSALLSLRFRYGSTRVARDCPKLRRNPSRESPRRHGGHGEGEFLTAPRPFFLPFLCVLRASVVILIGSFIIRPLNRLDKLASFCNFKVCRRPGFGHGPASDAFYVQMGVRSSSVKEPAVNRAFACKYHEAGAKLADAAMQQGGSHGKDTDRYARLV